MSRLYQSPLRVYICLGFLALLGIYSGFHLPVSLFPNSSKPIVAVFIPYGSMTSEEFFNSYGKDFEEQLRSISAGNLEIEKSEATYDSQNVRYRLEFKWGTEPREALREVELVTHSFSGQLPQELRDNLQVWSWDEAGGFLAVSFFSASRDLTELYKYLDPLLTPQVSHVKDAADVGLWNPDSKEIQIELNPEKMALLGLYPRDVDDALTSALNGNNGGTVSIGLNQLNISMPRQLHSLDDISKVAVPTSSGRAVHLSDIAHIDLGVPRSDSQIIKTSGAPSLILFANPKPGGNIKRMAEDILNVVSIASKKFPSDIHYKVIVDPSEFIRSSISNVVREVALAAFLAVGVLFLFIGNIKNVITAAIEIPLSIVLAFILMKLVGINLNLISLGGLALSAGMNVDASVVVMENIFRHFEGVVGPLSYEERFKRVAAAVAEVRFPIIASTIASLVVFLPLAFTSNLSNALLGDLALAVVFSHGFSAVVALLLVPTVRLQLMTSGASAHSHSPLETVFKKCEILYSRSLKWFIEHKPFKVASYITLVFLLVTLSFLIIPRLQKEIIGRPDTDWIVLYASVEGNTLVRQMENQSEEIEARLLEKFGDKIQYTFTQTRSPNNTQIMARLKDKKLMNDVWHEMEKFFVNTPEINYSISPWNPSELNIPDPPQLRIAIRGGNLKSRSLVGLQISDLLQEKQALTHITSKTGIHHREGIVLAPHLEQWAPLEKEGSRLLPSDLADISRVATVGRKIGNLPLDNHLVPVLIQYPENRVRAMTDLASFPIGIKGKLLPMKSLAAFHFAEIPPPLYRLNQQDITEIDGKMSDEDKSEGTVKAEQAQKLVENWLTDHPLKDGLTVSFEDAQVDMNEAINQLEKAVGLSILLIFLTMVLQMGDVMNALIVLVAVPLGFIGVLASLYIFKSTLSLNSVLGVILLNGIAVANSIILVDFLKKLVDRGLPPKIAALEASQKRMRPILMTSMTTALGMMPIALGYGDGGRILQPLGIAVVGGLGFSLLTTLYVVPSLQLSYLIWKGNHRPNKRMLSLITASFVFIFSPTALAASTEKYTFDQALAKILERSTNIHVQQTKVDTADWSVFSSKTAFLPRLSASASQSNYDTGDPAVQTLALNAQLNLFRAGADVAAVHAAEHDLSSQSESLKDVNLSAEQEAVEALASVIEETQNAEILDRNVAIFKTDLDIAHQRFARGILPRQEVDVVTIDLSNAEARLKNSQSHLATAQSALERLLGSYDVVPSWPWKNFLNRVREQITKENLFNPQDRPDVRAAAQLIAAEEARVKMNYRMAWPSLDLSFNPSLSQYPDGSGRANTTFIGMTMPLFNSLHDYSQYKIAQENKSAADFKYQQLMLDAKTQWRAARNRFAIALDTALTREKTVTLSRRVFDANQERFRRGRASANDIAVDHGRLIESELLAIQGWNDAHVEFSNLCHALGRSVSHCISQ